MAGEQFPRLQHAKVSLHYDARTVPASSANVIARFGNPSSSARIVLTTPLSGWFRCAGERGTGIAIALALAEEFSAHIPMTVIGASGHELGFMGGDASSAAHMPAPDAVFHIGSCVAARNEDGTGAAARLTRDLDVIVHVSDGTREAVFQALSPMNGRMIKPSVPADPACWIGESTCWAGHTKSMVSIAGASPLFHTAEDTAERGTTPELLRQSHDSIRDAFRAFIYGVGNG